MNKVDKDNNFLNKVMTHFDDDALFKSGIVTQEQAALRMGVTRAELAKQIALSKEATHMTAIGSYMTKAMTGSADVAGRGIISYIREELASRGLSEENMRKARLINETIVARNVIQEPISSKKLVVAKYLEESGGVETVLSKLLGEAEPLVEETFKTHISKIGGVDALAMLSMANLEAQGKTPGWLEKMKPDLDKLWEIQGNLRRFNENELRTVMTNVGLEDVEEKVTSVLAHQAKNTPLYESLNIAENMQIKLSTQMRAATLGNRDNLSMTKLYAQVSRQDKNASQMEIWGKVVQKLLEHNTGMQAEGQAAISGLTGARVSRAIRGWDTITDFAKSINTAPKLIGAGMLAMAGLMAVNAVLGDGTPEDYNDVPSVSNPSFQEGRYAPRMDNRHYSNAMSGNIHTSLITDGLTPSETMINHLSSSLGSHYSTISFRDDRRNSYSEAMLKYNM